MKQVPNDKIVTEGKIATYWIHEGILYALSKSVKRTVENITSNVELVKQITHNRPMPLLIFLTPSPIPDAATRKLSTEKLPEIYMAMAMVSKPGLASFIMRLLFKMQSPPIPMKQFSDENAAREWLKQFISK